MMKYRLLFPIIAVFTAGCEPSTLFDEDPIAVLTTDSGQIAVEDNGTITTFLVGTTTGSTVVGSNGFGFVVGINPNRPEVGGYAGITPNTNLGAQAPNGTATLTGTYSLAQFDNLILDASDQPDETLTSIDERAITLTADFDALSLTGTESDLAVNGIMTNGVLSGTVTYDGLDGTLVGEIGATDAVGSFSGSDANTVFAGGFIVSE